MEDDTNSAKENPTRKSNPIEVPERMSLGTEHILVYDICYRSDETAEVAKEFSNTENKEQCSSCNGQHIEVSQTFSPNLNKSVNSDHTGESQIKPQQAHWCSSVVNTGIEDSCLQTCNLCNQASAGGALLDSPRETPTGFKELIVPIDPDRKDEHKKDANGSPGSKNDSDLVFLDTEETIPSYVPQTQLRYLQNYDNRNLSVDSSACKNAERSFRVIKEADSSAMFIIADNISEASIDIEMNYITSMPKVNIPALSVETDDISTSVMPKVNICSTSTETYKISTIPQQNVNMSDDIYTAPASKVNISVAAVETDNSSALCSPKPDIATNLSGDCRDITNIQKQEIPDFSKTEISEVSPDVNKANTASILENVTTICCPDTFASNHMPNEANTCIQGDNQALGDYIVDDALFLVKNYISELERVATSIERILQSDSSELEINKKDDRSFGISDSYTEFECKRGNMGDNPEMIVGSIITELSTSFVGELPTTSAEVVDVKDDSVSLGEDLYNQGHQSENMPSLHEEIPVRCLARCDAPNSGLQCDQTRCSSVSSNSDIRAYGCVLPSHNVNNNSPCYVSASTDNNRKLVSFNAKAWNLCLDKMRKMRRILFPMCTETRYAKCRMNYTNSTANARLGNDDRIYDNINNNGNTISFAPRNITLSSDPASGPNTRSDTKQTSLKTRTQRLKNKLTNNSGFDILVFEGSKVYSVAQNASNCTELVGTFVTDVGHAKHDYSGKSQFGHEHPVNLPLPGCQSVNQSSDINDDLAATSEISGVDVYSKQESQTHNFGKNCEKTDSLKLSCSESVQNEPDTHLDSYLGDANQISCTESKNNYSLNVAQDEMLKVDTPAKAENPNTIHECELQQVRTDLVKRQLNAKRSRNTKRSKNRTYFDNKRHYRTDKFINEYPLLKIESSAQDGEVITKRITEPGNSSLPVSYKNRWETSSGASLPVDSRWASALGSNESSATDVTKIEYQRKRNFPIRIRTGSKQYQKDAYIPARTRRLTVESPAENLLVHTSYDRPNPKKIESVMGIEMANRRNVLYIGAEPDYIDTKGTRRLVCETECLSSKDPKTQHLVIENNASIASYGKINSVSEETDKRWMNDLSVASAERNCGTRSELLDVEKNDSGRSVNWYGASCARMIGNFVVIGTSKSIRSVMNMVQNQMNYSITSSVGTETVNLPEAGYVGGNTSRKAAVGDQSRGGESGDHLTVAVTDGKYGNCNNNNICQQSKTVGCKHKQRLENKVKESVQNTNHAHMALCRDRTLCSTYTMVFFVKRTRYCTNTAVTKMKQALCCTSTVIYCTKTMWLDTYTMVSCTKRIWCCTQTLVSSMKATPFYSHMILPSTNARFCGLPADNDSLKFVKQINLVLRSRADVKTYRIMILITYQLVNKPMRIISGELHLLSVNRKLAKTSPEPNRNNSSARENDWLEVNKMASRHSCEATTETTDLNPKEELFLQDCERKLSCPSCSLNQQMAYQDTFVPFGDLMTQVEATDINPNAESQTCDILNQPIERLPSARNSRGRMSLIEEFSDLMQLVTTFSKNYLRNCSSCCELSGYCVESSNQEIETQVHAMDINPSSLAQTGKSLIRIDSFSALQADTHREVRAVLSESNLRLHPQETKEIKPKRSYAASLHERNSLPTVHDLAVTGSSLPTVSPSFNIDHYRDSYPSNESNHTEELAFEYPGVISAPEELSGIEMLEAGLIWQDNGFVVQQEPKEARSGSVLSMYGHHKSELEFLMSDADVFDYHQHDVQSMSNSTSYMQNVADHESGGRSMGSIPTSRMSLTVLDPAPVDDFTFTKDQWQPRYRQRIIKGNTSLDRNIEEDGQSSEEARATTSDKQEPSPIVPPKRQKSDDQVLVSLVKDVAHRPDIMY